METIRKRYQIFLLHFAGGSCYSFDFLKAHIGANVDFIPLEIPGRGKRFDENLLTTKEAALNDYIKQIKALRTNQPYLIYGHSMGATLGLSVTKHLEDFGDAPNYLVVSGNPGPDSKSPEEIEKEKERGKRYLMNDEDFKEELRLLGGIPEELLQNDDLYTFFNPILRADFEVLEGDDHKLEKDILLCTPIYAIMGTDEEDHDKITNWNRFTSGSFHFETLKGDHFFINEHPQKLAHIFKTAMEYSYVT